MKKNARFFSVLSLLLCLLLLLTGCAASSKEMMIDASYSNAAMDMEVASEAPMAAVEDSGAGVTLGTQSGAPDDMGLRKIIYNASMNITADDPATAMRAIVDKAVALGGYIANSNTSNDDDGMSRVYLTIKIPFDQLDALVAAAEETGRVGDYRLSSDDISLSYYDVEARLKNAKAEEAQLLAILEKCTTIEEILEVRESLSSVRGDIESYQAQINLWDHLVAYTTLDIYIDRTPKTQESAEKELLAIWKASDVWDDMQRGFQNSARFMINAISAIGIVLAVAIIPCSILFLCIGLPIILHKRKKKRLADAAKAAASGETRREDTAAQSTPQPQPDTEKEGDCSDPA